jgi:short-subunit dehydrogenase
MQALLALTTPDRHLRLRERVRMKPMLRDNLEALLGDANMEAQQWKGMWALVTGASAGIGVALARELATGGAHLVLTARRQDRLTSLAAELTSKYGIRTEIVSADLAQPDAPDKIFAFTQEKGISVDVLVNNAGFGSYGEFAKSDLRWTLDMVQVNCSAVLHLTRLYLSPMTERRRGYILIVASTASFQAVPFISAYAATKAFDLLLAEGLAEEVKPFGVRVCALCPGSTESEFHEVANQSGLVAAMRNRETAEKVARVGLQALAAGKSYVISGVVNYLTAHSQRLVPRRFVTRITSNMFRPREFK